MKAEFVDLMTEELARQRQAYAALLSQRDHIWGQLAACRASALAVRKLIYGAGATCPKSVQEPPR